MTQTLTLVLATAALTWLTLISASLIKAKGWTWPGMQRAFGNRADIPEPGAFAGRAERTARNTQEAFMQFTAVALVAHLVAPSSPEVQLGAQIFFVARVVYIPVYYAGIAYVRTAVWTVGVAGMVMMALAIL